MPIRLCQRHVLDCDTMTVDTTPAATRTAYAHNAYTVTRRAAHRLAAFSLVSGGDWFHGGFLSRIVNEDGVRTCASTSHTRLTCKACRAEPTRKQGTSFAAAHLRFENGAVASKCCSAASCLKLQGQVPPLLARCRHETTTSPSYRELALRIRRLISSSGDTTSNTPAAAAAPGIP
jgi:hypothetical protein